MRLGLIGSGIGHSPSPAMHRMALRVSGLPGDYQLFDATPAELPGILARLRAGELRGCNVTVPYKTAMAAACDRLEGDAALCGAVNTISADNGELIGDNTDARGFELALSRHRLWPAPGCRAVVLGAGGAAVAVVLALGRVPAVDTAVVARRPGAGLALCRRLAAPGVRPLAWQESPALTGAVAAADLIVNATPSGVAGMPFRIEQVGEACTIVDLRYRPRPVDLVEAARRSGRAACDGEEMLLFQGMLSFQRWTGVEPPWRAARAALREAIRQ